MVDKGLVSKLAQEEPREFDMEALSNPISQSHASCILPLSNIMMPSGL